MLSASCSMEIPALTRRTLDWLSTSLLKGMSREGDSVIFWTFVICTLHDGSPKDSLLAFDPSRKARPPLTLAADLEVAHQAAAWSPSTASARTAESISGTKASR